MEISYQDPSFSSMQNQEIIEKLTQKVNHKRHQLKKLEKVVNDMGQALNQVEREKEDLKKALQNKQNQNTLINSTDNSTKIRELESIIGEQRNTIMMYSNELKSKGAIIDKLYLKTSDLQKEKTPQIYETERFKQQIQRLSTEVQIKTQENEALKQSVNSLNNHLQ